jgi:hypothetical protein
LAAALGAVVLATLGLAGAAFTALAGAALGLVAGLAAGFSALLAADLLVVATMFSPHARLKLLLFGGQLIHGACFNLLTFL